MSPSSATHQKRAGLSETRGRSGSRGRPGSVSLSRMKSNTRREHPTDRAREFSAAERPAATLQCRLFGVQKRPHFARLTIPQIFRIRSPFGPPVSVNLPGRPSSAPQLQQGDAPRATACCVTSISSRWLFFFRPAARPLRKLNALLIASCHGYRSAFFSATEAPMLFLAIALMVLTGINLTCLAVLAFRARDNARTD